MKTVYLGTSVFAVTVLERLAASEHRPQLVVTRPDRRAGRGRTLTPPPVAEAARSLGIELIQPEDLSAPEATEQVLGAGADALVVCAYGAIVREPLLSALPTFNVHPSLLPRWRGAAPIERAIEAGDTETGVSIMALEEGLDSGPVAARLRIAIEPGDTYGTLAPRLAGAGAQLLVEALADQPPFVPQPAVGITYAEKITAADRTITGDRDAVANERLVRALSPHIGARVQLPGGEMLGVHEARVVDDADDDGELHVEAQRVRFGALELTRVQSPGGRPMPAADWLRGRHGR